MRRTYRVTVVVSIDVDDETVTEVARRVQEQVNVFYHRLERDEDIRVVHQRECTVLEVA
jgi:hypothetical protein